MSTFDSILADNTRCHDRCQCRTLWASCIHRGATEVAEVSVSEVTIVVGVFVVVHQNYSTGLVCCLFCTWHLTDKTIYRWHETFISDVGRPAMSLGLKLCVSSEGGTGEVGGFQHSAKVAWPLLALAFLVGAWWAISPLLCKRKQFSLPCRASISDSEAFFSV